jgi:signal transduction histidine kinase
MRPQHHTLSGTSVRPLGSSILEGIMLDPNLPSAEGEPQQAAGAPHRRIVAARSAAAAAEASATGDSTLTQIRSVIAGLPEPILLTDDQDRVQLTNPSADALFAGRPVRDREDLHSRFEPAEAPVRTEEARDVAAHDASSAAGTVTVRLRQQPDRWFAVESFPLGRPETELTHEAGGGSVYVLRDVTRSPDLRPESEAFLSIMSHELRTPITTIYAGSSVLARAGALSPPASQTLAMDISAEAARLYDLVEDLIVVARLERRALDPLDEPVLLQRVADAIARVVAGRTPDVAFIRDGVTDAPPVRGDATYIEHAARDLALAAARVGGAGRPVTLHLDHDEDAGEVALRVLDRGPRLTPDDERQAFELPSGSAIGRLAGVGIGPFVARNLIEAMGGRVWARNRPDGGVETGFALPVASD